MSYSKPVGAGSPQRNLQDTLSKGRPAAKKKNKKNSGSSVFIGAQTPNKLIAQAQSQPPVQRFERATVPLVVGMKNSGAEGQSWNFVIAGSERLVGSSKKKYYLLSGNDPNNLYRFLGIANGPMTGLVTVKKIGEKFVAFEQATVPLVVGMKNSGAEGQSWNFVIAGSERLVGSSKKKYYLLSGNDPKNLYRFLGIANGPTSGLVTVEKKGGTFTAKQIGTEQPMTPQLLTTEFGRLLGRFADHVEVILEHGVYADRTTKTIVLNMRDPSERNWARLVNYFEAQSRAEHSDFKNLIGEAKKSKVFVVIKADRATSANLANGGSENPALGAYGFLNKELEKKIRTFKPALQIAVKFVRFFKDQWYPKAVEVFYCKNNDVCLSLKALGEEDKGAFVRFLNENGTTLNMMMKNAQAERVRVLLLLTDGRPKDLREDQKLVLNSQNALNELKAKITGGPTPPSTPQVGDARQRQRKEILHLLKELPTKTSSMEFNKLRIRIYELIGKYNEGLDDSKRVDELASLKLAFFDYKNHLVLLVAKVRRGEEDPKAVAQKIKNFQTLINLNGNRQRLGGDYRSISSNLRTISRDLGRYVRGMRQWKGNENTLTRSLIKATAWLARFNPVKNNRQFVAGFTGLERKIAVASISPSYRKNLKAVIGWARVQLRLLNSAGEGQASTLKQDLTRLYDQFNNNALAVKFAHSLAVAMLKKALPALRQAATGLGIGALGSQSLGAIPLGGALLKKTKINDVYNIINTFRLAIVDVVRARDAKMKRLAVNYLKNPKSGNGDYSTYSNLNGSLQKNGKKAIVYMTSRDIPLLRTVMEYQKKVTILMALLYANDTFRGLLSQVMVMSDVPKKNEYLKILRELVPEKFKVRPAPPRPTPQPVVIPTSPSGITTPSPARVEPRPDPTTGQIAGKRKALAAGKSTNINNDAEFIRDVVNLWILKMCEKIEKMNLIANSTEVLRILSDAKMQINQKLHENDPIRKHLLNVIELAKLQVSILASGLDEKQVTRLINKIDNCWESLRQFGKLNTVARGVMLFLTGKSWELVSERLVKWEGKNPQAVRRAYMGALNKRTPNEGYRLIYGFRKGLYKMLKRVSLGIERECVSLSSSFNLEKNNALINKSTRLLASLSLLKSYYASSTARYTDVSVLIQKHGSLLDLAKARNQKYKDLKAKIGALQHLNPRTMDDFSSATQLLREIENIASSLKFDESSVINKKKAFLKKSVGRLVNSFVEKLGTFRSVLEARKKQDEFTSSVKALFNVAESLGADVQRLRRQWNAIVEKARQRATITIPTISGINADRLVVQIDHFRKQFRAAGYRHGDTLTVNEVRSMSRIGLDLVSKSLGFNATRLVIEKFPQEYEIQSILNDLARTRAKQLARTDYHYNSRYARKNFYIDVKVTLPQKNIVNDIVVELRIERDRNDEELTKLFRPEDGKRVSEIWAARLKRLLNSRPIKIDLKNFHDSVYKVDRVKISL